MSSARPDLAVIDRQDIRDLIENWVVWRDSGNWAGFETLWHSDGRMSATWQQSGAAQFIEGCKLSWQRGIKVLHMLGGSSIDVVGARAVAQTKMTIEQRGFVHNIEVDVICKGRFYDLLEKRDGRWGLVFRQPIYEKDRMDPVTPGTGLKLDSALLDRFPEGYRHLAYLQSAMGFEVKCDQPGTRGPEVEALSAQGAAWLNMPSH